MNNLIDSVFKLYSRSKSFIIGGGNYVKAKTLSRYESGYASKYLHISFQMLVDYNESGKLNLTLPISVDFETILEFEHEYDRVLDLYNEVNELLQWWKIRRFQDEGKYLEDSNFRIEDDQMLIRLIRIRHALEVL